LSSFQRWHRRTSRCLVCRRTLTLKLKDARLRTNPAYELVLFDRLPEVEQRALGELVRDPECYGILRPKNNAAMSIKSISRDTALLLFSLQAAGPLPRYAAESLGEDCVPVIGKMILDGVLEIEAGGEMLSGPAASSWLREELAGDMQLGGPVVLPGTGFLTALSLRALDYAAALEFTDAIALSTRLYRYHAVPISRPWMDLLPNDVVAEDYLGLRDGAASRSLARNWMRLPEAPAWTSWRSRTNLSASEGSGSQSVYKLYVSPGCECLREAVEAVAEAVAGSNAFQWKVGKGAQGLLRPDKIVVYFGQFEDLQPVAAEIVKALEGCAVHGVPFTAELDGGGLVSWGVDPARDRHAVPWLRQESWRQKICDRLALALVQARDAVNSPEFSATRFAMERLRLEGIDTDTWTPDMRLLNPQLPNSRFNGQAAIWG
jgi:hypothetical protein